MAKEPADDSAKNDQKPKKKTVADISFAGAGRPRFTRRTNNAIGGDDYIGLDQIDDSGQQKKNQKKNTAADFGQRAFENMGSTPVDKSKRFEEEKESKPTG